MKKIAYASLAAATFYFALFVTIPLTSYVLAYIIGLYFIVEIVVALFILTKAETPETKVQITTQELEAIRLAKEAKLDVSKLIGSSMAIVAARESLGLEDGDYSLIFVKSDQKEVLAKINEAINSHKEDCK